MLIINSFTMRIYFLASILLSLFATTHIHSQNLVVANSDSFCFSPGSNQVFNVMNNDIFPGSGFTVYTQQVGNWPTCFRMNDKGEITMVKPFRDCCGTYNFKYKLIANAGQGDMFMATGEISVEVKCPKPNCTVIALETSADSDGSTNGAPKQTFYACEDTPVTYFVPYIAANTYTWIAGPGGSISSGANPAETEIIWANPGLNTITLTTTGPLGSSTTTYCIEVLPAPVASFTKSSTTVCQGSPISFTNTSSGATSYYWEFGDGNNSTLPSPTHQYGMGGTYIVTLYAYSTNYDPKGNPLCCCSDTMQMQVVVDDKPGPDIQWISTLCEGDTSKYWTTAQGCQYTWSVTTANGSPITFTGQGNDTICVVWPSGPYGVITLDLSNCSPAIYCELPVTVHVPIISSVEVIDGETVVCAGSKEPYSLPKWPGVVYDWTVTGGMIVDGDGTHEVTIMWGNGPAGTIHVDYSSPFLQGLPGHEDKECTGIADLTVQIRPEYALLPTPASVCKGSTTTISTTMTAPLGFTWISTPALPGFPVVGGTSVSITWPSTGYYTICAVPNTANYFCNDTVCTTLLVTETPLPDSITGPKIVCPGGTYTYFAVSNQNNVSFSWSVTNGTLSSATGNPVMVTWSNNGLPGTISLTQASLTDPYCVSGAISCPVSKKVLNKPLTITPGPACTNATQTYSCGPVQDPDAVYEWKIMPTGLGSVIGGQGTPTVTVQWNNTPLSSVMLTCIVKLCNEIDSVKLTVPLTAPIVPVITQSGNLCPGGTAFLNITGGTFTPIMWSTGGTTATIPISSAGNYIVTVTDVNQCTSITTFTANNVPGPNASISSPNILNYCVVPSIAQPFVTLTALTNPNYQYQWYCNGSPVGTWTTTPTLTHTSTSTPGTFVYYAQVMDMVTGCKKNSNILIVNQTSCSGGTGCTPQNYSLSISSSNATPNCNTGLFSVNASNATPVSWQFGDPLGNGNLGTASNAVHNYSAAGYYVAILTYTVPNSVAGDPPCWLQQPSSVCIPVVADFDVDNIVCRKYQFTNMSTYIPGNTITGVFWDFGDGNTSTGTNPTHTYNTCGTYTITLTVTTNGGCVATDTFTMTVPCDPVALYTLSSSSVCVGDAVKFTPSFPTGIISYLWDFGDMSSPNAANCPQHSYLMSGSYSSQLTVTDANGCTSSANLPILVYPEFMPDTIQYNPSLTVCNGSSVTLTAPPAVQYAWSNGATTASIQVSVSGWFGVTVTDMNGCSAIVDSVEVIILPPIQALLSGGQVICDNGCVTISTILGANYTYQWYDAAGQAIPFATSPSLQICNGNYQDSVYVIIADTINSCADTSVWWPITLASAPVAAITVVSGNLCAGTPSLLTASATPPGNINFLWSTGATTTSILAIQEGTYTVYVTDTLTGCKDVAFVNVNPLPDLCMMPTGCYEGCNPDTLCAPPGYVSYQWNFNGSAIPGATSLCHIVSLSGSYSVTAINSFGCSATSDTLILQLIPCCDEDDTKVKATPIQSGGDCCFTLDYMNTQDSLMSMTISTTGATLSIVPGSVAPPLVIAGITSTSITLANSNPTLPLPTGTFLNFIKICTENVTSSPVVLDISWNWPAAPMLCHDTVQLNCALSHDCVYISKDTIYCKSDVNWIYQFTVCNPSGNTFSFGYIDMIELAPSGVTIVPGSFTPAFPIAPGTCQTFAVTLSGPSLANQNFCFNLIVHEQNPKEFPGSPCCAIDSTICVFVPGCSPCDSLYIADIIPNEQDSCCFAMKLVNYHESMTYAGVQLCGLDPNIQMTVNNTPGSGWTLVNYSPGNFILEYSAGFMPLGTFTLPEICVTNESQALNTLELKWLGFVGNGYVALCKDTFTTLCPNDCGYNTVQKIGCTDNGGYSLWLTYNNTSQDTIYSLHLAFEDPALVGYNTSIPLPGILPGGSYGPFQVVLGPPAMGGDTICFYTTMHNRPNGEGDACCRFYTCIVLPDCTTEPPKCLCDEDFELQVLQGFNISLTGFTGVLTPLGELTPCDKVIWDWLDENTSSTTVGNASVTHVFPGFGEYKVCMTVIRTTPSGKQCKVKITKEIAIVPAFFLYLTPNPASDILQVRIKGPDDVVTEKRMQITDMKGSLVYDGTAKVNEKGFAVVDVANLLNGIYFVRVFDAYHQEIRKFIKIE